MSNTFIEGTRFFDGSQYVGASEVEYNTTEIYKYGFINKIIIRSCFSDNPRAMKVIGLYLMFNIDTKKFYTIFGDNTGENSPFAPSYTLLGGGYNETYYNSFYKNIDPDAITINSTVSFSSTELNAPNGFDEIEIGGYSFNDMDPSYNYEQINDIRNIVIKLKNVVIAEYGIFSRLTGRIKSVTNYKSPYNMTARGFLYAERAILPLFNEKPEKISTVINNNLIADAALYALGSYSLNYSFADSGSIQPYKDPVFQPQKIDGGWSKWSSDNKCRTLGPREYGVVSQRFCNNPLASNGGKECVGESTKILPCPSQPVDGGWSEWKIDGKCEKQTDGTFKQSRSHVCNNPFPSNGGITCVELPAYEYLVSCDPPVNGGWSEWEIEDECNQQTDGTYKKQKNRTCTNPEPEYGGENCVGASTELISCDAPINGGWSEWVIEDECKKQTNGTYKKQKNRKCDNPLPQNDGNSCDGEDTILVSCKPKDTINYTDEIPKEIKIFLLLLIFILVFSYMNRDIKSNPQFSTNVSPSS